MTIDQVLQLKGAGYTAEEIAMIAPHIVNSGDQAPAAAAADPEPSEAPQTADASNNDVLAALNKLTESIQAGNRGAQGSSSTNDTDVSNIFETIINGINKKGV